MKNLNGCFRREIGCLSNQANVRVLPRLRLKSIDKLYEEFEVLNQESSREVEQAIRRWVASGMTQWPKLSAQASRLLAVRLRAAEQLLDLLIRRQGRVLDEKATTAVAGRILIDWWRDRGREMGADIWVFEQWNRIQDLQPRQLTPLPMPAARPEIMSYAAVA